MCCGSVGRGSTSGVPKVLGECEEVVKDLLGCPFKHLDSDTVISGRLSDFHFSERARQFGCRGGVTQPLCGDGVGGYAVPDAVGHGDCTVLYFTKMILP